MAKPLSLNEIRSRAAMLFMNRSLLLGFSVSIIAAISGCSLNSTSTASWQILDSRSDSKTVTISYEMVPNCQRLDEIKVNESTTQVTIQVILQDIRQDEGVVCQDILFVVTSEVELIEPLGSRKITGSGLTSSDSAATN